MIPVVLNCKTSMLLVAAFVRRQPDDPERGRCTCCGVVDQSDAALRISVGMRSKAFANEMTGWTKRLVALTKVSLL